MSRRYVKSNVRKLVPILISARINAPRDMLTEGKIVGKLSEFDEIDQSVNEAKSQMDKVGIDEERLNEVLKDVNLYQPLNNYIRCNYNGQLLTNAWLKMYEMLVAFKLITLDGGKVCSFHNAEFPGGFISATNHWLATEWNTRLDWLASSLVDPTSTAVEDYENMWKSNPDRWLMNVRASTEAEYDPNRRTNNGDTTDADNLLDMAAQVKARFDRLDLYTADGGIDVSANWNEQETMNIKLHFGQALAGLITLTKGGSMVLKQYTLHKPFTISLVMVLARHFEEFRVVKPVTSKPTNSECYLVGKGFIGIHDEMKDYLLKRLRDWKNNETELPLITIRQADVSQILSVSELLGRQQVAFLNEMMEFYRSRTPRTAYAQTAEQARSAWLDKNKILLLKVEAQLNKIERKISRHYNDVQHGKVSRARGKPRHANDRSNQRGGPTRS